MFFILIVLLIFSPCCTLPKLYSFLSIVILGEEAFSAVVYTLGGSLDTIPLMYKVFVTSTAFEVTLILLLKFPNLPLLLYIAFISLVWPGAIGSFGHSGVVHPQEALTAVITIGSFPTLVNLKTCVAFTPSITVLKSWDSSVKENFPQTYSFT